MEQLLTMPADLELSGVMETVTPGGVRLVSADIPPGRHDEVWRTLLRAHPRTGWYPVLGRNARIAAERAGDFPVERQGAAALQRALAIDPSERMDLLRRSEIEWTLESFMPDEHESVLAGYDASVLARELGGPVVPAPGRAQFTASNRHLSVLLVPAAAGYEVPVLVPGLVLPANWFGAPWHPNLTPDDHLAILRLWHERYGAELYYAVSDLELAVSRPPVDPLDLARCTIEQVIYCGDLEQSLGDPIGIARGQTSGPHWSFWWD